MTTEQPVPLWDQVHELRKREERRSRAGDGDVVELLLLAKVSEESNEAVELYRRSRGWGTDGVTNATATEVYDEVCSTIMAGLVALDRLCPDAGAHWAQYLAYGYQRAKRENEQALAS